MPESTGGTSEGEHPETVLTTAVLRAWDLPTGEGDKESHGRVLIIGGSRATPGAILLAAEAALRAGAGKLQIATVESTATQVAIQIPEAMVVGLPEDEGGDISPAAADTLAGYAESCDVVLFGPGIMSPDAAWELGSRLLPRLDCAVVIDALGMACLTKDVEIVSHLSGHSVLSPNFGELARTIGVDEDELEKDVARHVRDLARDSGAVVVSGGATTWLADPEGHTWRDESGGPGLGASGSGDVKAGALCGLLARSGEPTRAAAWATYAHGRAGERCSARIGTMGYLARELLLEIPKVLSELTI